MENHTVVSARLIGQFGLILWGETFDSGNFFLSFRGNKKCSASENTPKNFKDR
jgi:hypothetical protein